MRNTPPDHGDQQTAPEAGSEKETLIREYFQRISYQPRGCKWEKANASELTVDEWKEVLALMEINHAAKTPAQMRRCRELGNIEDGLSRQEALELAIITESMPRMTPQQEERFHQLVHQQHGLTPEEALDCVRLQARKKRNVDAYYARPDVKARQRQMMERQEEHKDKADPEFEAALFVGFSQDEVRRLQQYEQIIYDSYWNS